MEHLPINDEFPEEHLFSLSNLPWFAYIVNYLVVGEIPKDWSTQDKRKFLVELRNFYWDDPNLFKYCPDQIIRRCVPNDEVISVLKFCHFEACDGHFLSRKPLQIFCNADFIGLHYSKTLIIFVVHVKMSKVGGNFSLKYDASKPHSCDRDF